MANDESSRIQRQLVFESLFDKLSETHSGVHQDRMAKILFQAETETKHLVGLLNGCEKAAFYDERMESIIAIPFDHHETRDSEAEQIWQRQANEQAWIELLRDEFEWLHPRYR